jgi:hypothetical protein
MLNETILKFVRFGIVGTISFLDLNSQPKSENLKLRVYSGDKTYLILFIIIWDDKSLKQDKNPYSWHL